MVWITAEHVNKHTMRNVQHSFHPNQSQAHFRTAVTLTGFSSRTEERRRCSLTNLRAEASGVEFHSSLLVTLPRTRALQSMSSSRLSPCSSFFGPGLGSYSTVNLPPFTFFLSGQKDQWKPRERNPARHTKRMAADTIINSYAGEVVSSERRL